MTRKNQIRIASLIGVLVALGTMPASSQTLVQNLSIHLTAYGGTTAKPVRIATKDVIASLLGTNVPGARLLLATPAGNPPGTVGNLNASLWVAKGDTVLLQIPSPDEFNLFQDFVATHTTGNRTGSRAINRFSFDSGGFHVELQGFSTWNIAERTVHSVNLDGSGAFVCTVNGAGTVDGVTPDNVPMHGTITASAPRPAQ